MRRGGILVEINGGLCIDLFAIFNLRSDANGIEGSPGLAEGGSEGAGKDRNGGAGVGDGQRFH